MAAEGERGASGLLRRVTAISIREDQVASVDPDRWIGCGLCVNYCPEEALTLVSKTEEKRREPPPTSRFMRSSQDIESGIS